jgi:4-hydroxy-tetrahydrodipicolinate synthase
MREKIGVSAALATPFGEEGDIDWPRFCSHAGRLLGQGMQVVTAFGTTGEGVSLPAAARAPLYDKMAQAGISASQLVECVYGPPSQEAGGHMRRALERGVAGILLAPPFYFKQPGEEGVYRWFAEALEAAGPACRDIIVYNIPQLTGVKDSSGDWEQTAALLGEHRDLAILVGHEGDLARAVRQGASGAISGVANFAPALVAKLVRGEDDAKIDAILDLLLKLPVVPAVKSVLAVQAGDEVWRRVRAPLTSLSATGDLAACATIMELAGNRHRIDVDLN